MSFAITKTATPMALAGGQESISQSGDPGWSVPSGLPSGILVPAKPQQEGSRRVSKGSERVSIAQSWPADHSFQRPGLLSAARAERFNPHSGRGREGHGFVQPGSI